jgi:hypothetical protein
VISLFSVRALNIQHAYYRQTRTTKTALEERLNLAALAPRPTRGMRGHSRSLKKPLQWNVTDLTVGVMSILGIVNAVAFVWILASPLPERPVSRGPSPASTPER